MLKHLLAFAATVWVLNGLASALANQNWLLFLLIELPMIAIAAWVYTRKRLYSIIGGIAALVQGLLSPLILLGFFVRFMDPVVSLGIKVFGVEILTLHGGRQISIYFLIRMFLFLCIGMLLLGQTKTPSKRRKRLARATVGSGLPL